MYLSYLAYKNIIQSYKNVLQNRIHHVFLLEWTGISMLFCGRNMENFVLRDQAHCSTPILNFILSYKDPRSYFLAQYQNLPNNNYSKRCKKPPSEITTVVSV